MAPKVRNVYFLFAMTVVIWGTTWFVILGQLGSVHPVVSVGWRFLVAGILMFCICFYRRISLNLCGRSHAKLILLGLMLFSVNYSLFYTASLTLTTGLISIVFSTMVFWNSLGAKIFLGRVIDYRALSGGVLGLIGLSFIFWQDLVVNDVEKSVMVSVGLCLLATLCASLGNIISASLQFDGESVWSTSAFGMIYGSLITLTVARLAEIPLVFEWTLIYVSSFVYLVVFGSVIAFGSYLTLIGQLGAGKAAYAAVLFPVVAVALSIVFESFRLNFLAIVGIGIVLIGNWLALSQPKTKNSSCTA